MQQKQGTMEKLLKFTYPMQLKWAAIRINLTFSDTMLYPEGISKLTEWEELITQEVDTHQIKIL